MRYKAGYIQYMSALPDRHSLRAHPLDGAMLFFQPSTGLHVRVGSAATRTQRRRAPRVVAFGITNRCNLSCGFCSRDRALPSRWTRAGALAALRELDAAGVLEVAFGGGEPFLFPEFLELLQDLHQQTRLALNVTTNGSRIDAQMAAALKPLVGVVRLSVYPDNPWRKAADHLSRAGVGWGANVLVDGPSLATLPALLTELQQLGSGDVSLLRYVGPDPGLRLSPEHHRHLDQIIAESPLPTRISVCFGPQLHAPLLFAGADGSGDCGAGRDFLSISANGGVRACSFQDREFPATSGAEILEIWRSQGQALGQASPRPGCARAEGRLPPEDLSGVRIWRSFSGNNSGECLMVARFSAVADAARYLNDLLPGYQPEAAMPPEWQQLLAAEGLAAGPYGECPREMVAVGRSVFALGYGVDDLFTSLRSLAWKRGAEVAPRGIHLHEHPRLVFAIRAKNGDDAEQQITTFRSPQLTIRRHGDWIFGLGLLGSLAGLDPRQKADGLAADAAALTTVAAGRPHALTLAAFPVSDQDLLASLQRFNEVPEEHRRAFLRFLGPTGKADAARFAAGLESPVLQVGSVLLVEPPFGKRLAVGASQRGASVQVLSSRRCSVKVMFIRPNPKMLRKLPPVDAGPLVQKLQDLLRQRGCREEKVRLKMDDHSIAPLLVVESDTPGLVLQAAEVLATTEGLNLWTDLEDCNPLSRLLRQLHEEVSSAPR